LQDEQKPLWLINKKPKSKIINYKTSIAQNMIKISAGDQNPLINENRDKSVRKNEKDLILS